MSDRMLRGWRGMEMSLVLLLAGVMFWWSWGKWPDVLIDFGRELYVPWQLVSGKTLYADLAYLNGPLSPYLNALWFRVFGVSLWTLAWCNLAILVCLTWLLHRILRQIGDRSSATLGCLVFIAVFAFGQLVGIGNYNYICPYSHELTHGLAFSLLAIWGVSVSQRLRNPLALVCTGLGLGLAFLTKAEVFLAAALAVGLGLGLTLMAARPPRRQTVKTVGSVVGGALIPPLVAFLLLTLSARLPSTQALQGLAGTWRHVLGSDVFSLHFYRYWMGTLDPVASLWKILTGCGWYAAFFGPVAAASLLLRHPAPRVSAALLVAIGGGLGAVLPFIRWAEAFRPLPVVLLLLGVACFVTFVNHRQDPELASRCIIRLTMITFAFLLLGKMLLYARLSHTGFVLAMPATLVFITALLDWIPSFLTSRGGHGRLFRAVGLTVILFGVAAHVRLTAAHFSRKVYRVGTGPDLFFADARGLGVQTVLQVLRQRSTPQDTLVVVPEGVMINYLARRRNPTPYYHFDPLPLLLYGEERMLASLQTAAPTYLALADVDLREYGYRRFGVGVGEQIAAWIHRHYQPVEPGGGLTQQRGPPGLISLLQRRQPAVEGLVF